MTPGRAATAAAPAATTPTAAPRQGATTGAAADPAGRADHATGGGPAVVAADVTKAFGQGPAAVRALDRISFQVATGEFCCLIGASGCGKSTVLNLVAGLDAPTAGTVDVRGRSALMFQEAALFPWLTARQNVELALKLRDVARRERRERADELLATVHLDGFGDRRPHELSGGMRQRVALARAFAQDADVLLMDEPFGALDAITRDLLHDELERLWSDRRLTVLFVTHNVREAVRLGDRVVLLTSRPGTVAEVFTLDLPRPRRLESAEVASAAAPIVERLRSEVRRHARH